MDGPFSMTCVWALGLRYRIVVDVSVQRNEPYLSSRTRKLRTPTPFCYIYYELVTVLHDIRRRAAIAH